MSHKNINFYFYCATQMKKSCFILPHLIILYFKMPHQPTVGLLVAIARERSEAFYPGYTFRTYGTKVLTCPIGIWREAPDYIRATRFSGE